MPIKQEYDSTADIPKGELRDHMKLNANGKWVLDVEPVEPPKPVIRCKRDIAPPGPIGVAKRAAYCREFGPDAYNALPETIE